MKSKNALKLKARWECDTFPAGQKLQRGLLLEVTGREIDRQVKPERQPLNLALVIDRSGSMSGARLAAAREAAIGISKQLGKKDRLSIVAFDDEINVLLNGVRQDKAGIKAARSAISKLRSRGCTDLGGGWLTGAKCVANVMDTEGLVNGHVLLLSDGHANRGITDPNELARHASELAARGVTSSCVGIGDRYSSLQLDAIAEAGNGNLHHSNVPGEIVDIVLGELGELTDVAAHSARLKFHFPENAVVQQLTRFKAQDHGHELSLQLGDIGAGRTRRVAFMVNIDKIIEPGDSLPFRIELEWKEGAELTKRHQAKKISLGAVHVDDFDPKGKRKKVSRVIADLWLARMGYEAMLLNERGLYADAVETFTNNDMLFEELLGRVREDQRQRILASKMRMQDAVRNEWHGSSKLTSLSLAKKMMRSDHDYTGRSTSDWSENTPD
jgi:Mg-chelatase subunit ChlD